ncbi:MAG: hypothetical protein RLN77_03485, partial [Rhodospirillales bacterium]
MSDALKPFLAKAADGTALTAQEAEDAFAVIMSGDATSAQIAGLLMALRVRGETVDEITGAVRAMRAKMLPVTAPAGAIDVVGTGGDGSGTFNVSTGAALVVAGCGVPVAKHGNRALSSKSARITPWEGEAFLISAISPKPSREASRRACRKRRGAACLWACFVRSCRLTALFCASTWTRLSAMILSSTLAGFSAISCPPVRDRDQP